RKTNLLRGKLVAADAAIEQLIGAGGRVEEILVIAVNDRDGEGPILGADDEGEIAGGRGLEDVLLIVHGEEIAGVEAIVDGIAGGNDVGGVGAEDFLKLLCVVGAKRGDERIDGGLRRAEGFLLGRGAASSHRKGEGDDEASFEIRKHWWNSSTDHSLAPVFRGEGLRHRSSTDVRSRTAPLPRLSPVYR